MYFSESMKTQKMFMFLSESMKTQKKFNQRKMTGFFYFFIALIKKFFIFVNGGKNAGKKYALLS